MSSPTDPATPTEAPESATSAPSAWSKLSDQLPAVILTVAIIGGLAYWMHTRTLAQTAASQQAELALLRDQTNAEIKAAAEENRRQIEAVNTLLKDAISKRSAEVFMTDDEVNKLNQERVNQLAAAIATKIQPFTPLPTTPEDAERQQTEQVNKVGDRLSQRIQPILAQMAADQNLTRDSINGYSQKISDQIGVVLTSELAKNQQLNNNLQSTQALAQESLALSHEITALYISSLKDQGLLTRLLTLPANVVKDVANFNIVEKRDKEKIAQDLVNKMADIEKRLSEVQAQQPAR
jgi:hypothetical protein